MDRNRLEKLLHNLTHKTVARLITVELTSWLKKWLNKSNYVEYIKGIILIAKNHYKGSQNGDFKRYFQQENWYGCYDSRKNSRYKLF